MAMAGEGSLPDTRVRVTEEPGYPPWPETAASKELADLVVAAGAELGQKISLQLTSLFQSGNGGKPLHFVTFNRHLVRRQHQKSPIIATTPDIHKSPGTKNLPGSES